MSTKTTTRFSAESIRASLWFWPSLAAVGSLLLTLALFTVRPEPETRWASWAWPGDTASATALLQVVATATMTATTLTFSLTVVALQLASQQFSPRLLREFARDRFTQFVLALLVSTFVVALTGLRGVHTERPLPVLVIALVLVMGLASAGALLGFVGYIVRALRVDTMMVAVHEEAVEIIANVYPPHGDESKAPRSGLPGPEGGTLVPARRSGFVRATSPETVVAAASRHGVFVRLALRPGDHVIAGAPIASVWREDGARAGSVEGVVEPLLEAVGLGFERTNEEDPALGLRQLTDIAVKAISPGINDPVTAAHAVGYCADLLTRLQASHLGPQEYQDEDGVPRLVTPDRDLRYYLDLVCAPVRRFGRAEPLVLTALLRMLRDCATTARDDEQRREIARQLSLVLDEVGGELRPYDVEAVRDLGHRVELALRGEVDEAYRDRAGETRSI